MNFKTRSLIVLLIFSVFLLSSCEVYQTLYGTGAQKPVDNETQLVVESVKVVRVEGNQAKDPAFLAKQVYATAVAAGHDPFKVGENPLGPFDGGKSLGFTLGEWLSAAGGGAYAVDKGNAQLNLTFSSLVKNGVYTVWCSRVTFPPDPNIVDMPCGALNGSENAFIADEEGNGKFFLKLKPLEQSTKQTATMLAVAYHSDGKTHGASPGEFGLNSHVQIFYMMPESNRTTSPYKFDVKFVNHIAAGFPEQDVFVEQEEKAMEKVEIEAPEEAMKKEPEITAEVVKEEIPAEKGEAPESMEKPTVVVVQETDKVNLVPQAQDPDKETSLTFTFTSPLNENGEWQTTYGDSGEYTVTVTASDGELTTAREVLIIVNKKEEPPQIDSSKPIESGLKIDETEVIEFSVVTSDLNKDSLSYSWKVDGDEVGKDVGYAFQTDYDSAGTHTVKVEVSDGLSSASKIWSVDVRNVNRKPVLEDVKDVKSKETDTIVITALATDSDNDKISYSISDNRFRQDDNVFTWQTDYDSAGTFTFTVSASDGQDTTQQELSIEVENVNRPPVITDIVQKK